MKLQRLYLNISPRRRVDLLLVLLGVSIAGLAAYVVIGGKAVLQHLLGAGGSWTRSAAELGALAQIWMVVSILLFLIVGWGFWVVLRDRQHERLRMRRSEQRYRDIINHAGEAIFLLDEDGVIREWNKAAERLFGVPRRDALHRRFQDLKPCCGLGIVDVMRQAARLSRSVTREFTLRRRGQQEMGQITLTVSPIADPPDRRSRAQRQPRAFVAIARDITSQKQLETRMSETEKLAGIGQFAAGIAHQLNTPLGSILLSAQMLEESLEREEDVEDVQRIVRQTEQCRVIIKGLLNFARPSGRQRQRLKLAEIVRDTVFLMDKAVRNHSVTVEVREEGPGEILGNRNEIEQVIFNLLANALDAMPDGGTLTVTVGEDHGEVVLEFQDTGPGIPEEHREDVFLPFFTTKEYGKGTGLGLSIVARIVHEHGGHVELGEGPGAHFIMTFPPYRPGLDAETEPVLGDEERPVSSAAPQDKEA